MKSKKVIVLLISLTLLVSMTLPGTVAVYADQAADSGDRNLMPENEEKDTSPEGAGDPEPPGLNQSADPSEPDENAAPSNPSEPDENAEPSNPPEPDENPDLSGPPEGNQGVNPSQPEEPGNTGEQNPCTCGAAQGQAHGVECPLYVPPDVIPTEPAKSCICGHEDGPHDENCPLYEAPEGPVEEEEKSDGASLTICVQVSGEDQGNAVLNLTGPGDYCKRIVVQGGDSVTLSGLEAGKYAVTGGTSAKSVTLEAGGSDSVDITVTRSSYGWLTGEAYQTFRFNS